MPGVLVHEWISRTGGSERVLDAMADAFPDADVHTLWNDDRERRYPGRRVHETWLARTPLRRSKAAALPFMPVTWRSRPAADVDWALVSSHLFAHHVSFAGRGRPVRKYVYVHTPARYIWTPELDRRGSGLLPRAAATVLRPLDRRRAREAYAVAANSHFVRRRIADCWGVDSTVIYPPVEVTALQAVDRWEDTLTSDERALLDSLPGTFVLGASRFIPYKRLDAVIAAGESASLPVVLAGAGPLRARLAEQGAAAAVPVRIVDHPSDRLLYALYRRALVYVFPAVEDFGIMPVEAMALGTPVVTCAVGGGAETVVDGLTGAHVPVTASPDVVADAIRRAARLGGAACAERARQFSTERFVAELTDWVGHR